ncbi:glycosyltransferase family 2 protein [Pseudogemmobacter bohemicus]|uniref:glycosyltransferase family 2 protein n=1 Tax=Pseudogemmobacter bohemicus TaxID=2250708 RepID=UPI001300AF39|nr:glycosyltransferase family 2 protein [Pseudogemmobacter bohemicus]
MTATEAALTVLIPTHNRPELLQRAVASALADLPRSAEVLVIDDASSIPAAELLAGMEDRLRVLRNEGPRGAAGARNFGAAQARGAVILFLDDDDEVLPGYAARVLEVAAREAVAYGFSAVLRRDASGREEQISRRFATGTVPAKSALRHKIAGLGTGFWIRRDRFLALGGLDPAQRVDEDTSLCCALVASGSLPWYEAEPGMRIHILHSAADAAGAQLTQGSNPELVLECYLRTWTRHQASFPPRSEARWFLGARYLRRAAKLGARSRIRDFTAGASPLSMALAFRIFGAVKLMASKSRRG